MKREKAYRILAFYEYQNISKEERETLILNVWGIYEEEEDFYLLDKNLQEEMKNFDEPQQDILDRQYDNLVLLALEEGYTSFSNKELKRELYKVTRHNYNIVGEEPYFYQCPCCKEKTLFTQAEYDICSNCLWEDDGTRDIYKYSPVNHMTLKEGKLRYKKNGRV